MKKTTHLIKYSPKPGYQGIKAWEPLSYWLLLEATYGLGIKLTRKLAEGKKSFIIGEDRVLTITPRKFRV